MTEISYAQAINLAIRDSLTDDPNLLCTGLGVTDPKAVFGTTQGLHQEFGNKRVFDMPVSENAMTGVGIGAAINGTKVLMTHQRVDFFLLGLDQLINNAAKWHYTFQNKHGVPLTIRLIIGRGWGQGPTHSQSLQSWFAHIPGLKVYMPGFVNEAYHMLRHAIDDPNPVIFLEHRWLHSQLGQIDKAYNPNSSHSAADRVNYCSINHLKEGADLTIVTSGYQSLEALQAVERLNTELAISIDLLAIRSVKPLDYKSIGDSVKRTGRLLVLDNETGICSIASEILSYASEHCWSNLKSAPQKLAYPDCPEPTSYGLTKDYHIDTNKIMRKVIEMLQLQAQETLWIEEPEHHDIPNPEFKGPF